MSPNNTHSLYLIISYWYWVALPFCTNTKLNCSKLTSLTDLSCIIPFKVKRLLAGFPQWTSTHRSLCTVQLLMCVSGVLSCQCASASMSPRQRPTLLLQSSDWVGGDMCSSYFHRWKKGFLASPVSVFRSWINQPLSETHSFRIHPQKLTLRPNAAQTASMKSKVIYVIYSAALLLSVER